MVATKEQIAFAQSRIDYFENVLKSGVNDKLKVLIRAVIEKESGNSLSAESIARVIRESYNKENRDSKSKNVIKAAEKLTGRSKFDSYQEEDFKKDVAKVLKGYDFINNILENIPNKATDVLINVGNTFIAYADILGDKGKEDQLKSAKIYYRLIGTVCGFAPFDGEMDGLNENTVKCYNHANKVAYALLQNINCGSDKLDCFKVKESCYYGIADKLYDLYNRGNTDDMRIDLMSDYPLHVFIDSTNLPEIKNIISDNEVSECLRAKKKQAEEAIEKLVKATDVMEGVDAETIKYNNEALDKIVDKIEEKRKIEVLDDKTKKEMDDWLIYAKGQMEEKDKEIELLKAQLEKISSNDELINKADIEIKTHQDHEEL